MDFLAGSIHFSPSGPMVPMAIEFLVSPNLFLFGWLLFSILEMFI